MLKIKNVLVPTDYSEIARRAFDHARFAADHFGASLHVIHLVDAEGRAPHAPGPFDGDRTIEEAVEFAGEPVDDLDSFSFEGPASFQHPRGPDAPSDSGIRLVRRTAPSVSEGILSYADEIDADLIVMGTRGRSGPRRLFMGSRAEEVVHGAQCPVLTIRTGSLTVPGRGVSRILVPVDFSEVSRSQIRHAQELAETYGAELDVLHVIEVPDAALFYAADDFNASVPSVVGRAREGLAELVASGRRDLPTRIHVLVGHPAVDILDFAEAQGCDLIVIATHNRMGGRHMLLGSVAEQVIRRAPLLVATMKASGKSLVEQDEKPQAVATAEPDARRKPTTKITPTAQADGDAMTAQKPGSQRTTPDLPAQAP